MMHQSRALWGLTCCRPYPCPEVSLPPPTRRHGGSAPRLRHLCTRPADCPALATQARKKKTLLSSRTLKQHYDVIFLQKYSILNITNILFLLLGVIPLSISRKVVFALCKNNNEKKSYSFPKFLTGLEEYASKGIRKKENLKDVIRTKLDCSTALAAL